MTQKDDVSEISRRQILAGLGLAAGAAAVTRAAAVPKSDATWDHDTDIVCVGGGASGCTAAVTAVSRGSKVILLEKAPILGGTSRIRGPPEYHRLRHGRTAPRAAPRSRSSLGRS